LFRWFCQYSVICHSSKYIRLTLIDFSKNRVFYRNCMWLQMSQILKQIHQRKHAKIHCQFCVLCSCCHHKISKNTAFFIWSCADYLSFRAQHTCNREAIGSHLDRLRLCGICILNIVVFNGLFSVYLVNPVQLLCSQKPGQQ